MLFFRCPQRDIGTQKRFLSAMYISTLSYLFLPTFHVYFPSSPCFHITRGKPPAALPSAASRANASTPTTTAGTTGLDIKTLRFGTGGSKGQTMTRPGQSLKTHANDEALADEGFSTASWPIQAPAVAAGTPYRYFRMLQHRKNSSYHPTTTFSSPPALSTTPS